MKQRFLAQSEAQLGATLMQKRANFQGYTYSALPKRQTIHILRPNSLSGA